MATSNKEAFGTNNQTITITIDSLTNGSAQQSTAIDNSTNLYFDALVSLSIVYPNLAPSGDKAIYIYAYGTSDGGATYTDGASGTNGSFTVTDWANLPLVKTEVAVQNKTLKVGPFSIAKAFDGILPDHWGIIVRNASGQTFSTGCTANYQGVYSTNA